ncbi:AfsR/SARP family transcriptional regulator [Ornithinimicrobium cavernae]|uniref:AfsR/SARP family transcriptional regulator n=1 Tax=Ornithinimicrobium cavernae TaxID=2666047 RepID=UPI000D690211|nr:BTAD domain-containing putative transcriptional regulator [Ornithinimicrobium cavernae]
MVHVQLLGGIGAVGDDGTPLPVGPSKSRAVLAALALSVGQAVPVTRLIDVLWGERPPRTADKTLQGYVAQLRRVLGPQVIARVGDAYRLDLAPERVDVERFRARLADGDLDGALRAWTGTPLAGLSVPGLQAAVDALVEQWLTVRGQVLHRQAVTDPGAVIAPLTELTATYPFREELWAALMTALYRVGRQADALGAYQRARQHLVDELGVEPGPRLRELEGRILAQDEELDTGARDPGPAPVTPLPGPARPSGTVTFGFAKVADATRLWASHGRKMALAMARLDTVLGAVTARHHGTVNISAGESIGVVFHRADDAAAWALELQLAVDQEPWPGGVDLRLRLALHTGETEEHNGGYFGPTVHAASRLAAAAHAGQVLVSDVTAALLDYEGLRALGAHRLDGAAGQRDLWQLDDGAHPPPRTATAGRGNLPGRAVRLVGREAELADVAEAMELDPVVTLVGPGGIGKTTLALAAARRAAVDDPGRRTWLVELAEVTSDAAVPHAVAEALGIAGSVGRTRTESIVAALRSRTSLVLLDNCEHVAEGAAALAQAIADDGADTWVLATSREPLDIPAERVFPVAPLDPTGAGVELFVRAARAAAGAFPLHEDRAEVEEICRRLDGLPLAIELAAARTVSLSAAQLLARLDDRFRLLESGRRARTSRHRTLRATVQWSYDLLSRPQQAIFERLAVFAGPFDLTAVEEVATDGDLDAFGTSRLLDDLVNRSMVAVEPGPFGRRFRMLETLRAFALEHLRQNGGQDAVAGRHAAWCAGQVAGIGALLRGPGEIEGVTRLAELWPNLRAAVDWACDAADPDLADALVRPVAAEVDLRRRAEIGDWAERILQLLPAEDEERVVRWLLWAGHRRAQAGDHAGWAALVSRYGYRDHPVIRFNTAYLSGVGEDSHAASPAAVDWLRAHGEGHAADLVEVSGVASSLMTLQRFRELETLAATMAERHRHGAPTLRYFALGMQGYAAQYQGRPGEAAQFFTEAEQLELPPGSYRVIQTVQARITFQRGDRVRGYRLLRDNIEVLLDSDYTDVTRMIAVEFITMMAATNHLVEAARVLPYLDTTGDFGVLVRAQLGPEVTRRLDAQTRTRGHPAPARDARAALTCMRDVLTSLSDD